MATEWFNIAAKKDGGETVASVDIFGVIGGDVLADEFIARHRSMGAGKTLVNIHSPGGSVVEGFGIYSYLAGQPNVTTQVVGIAGSIGSVILQAGKVRRMPKNSFVLIHNASGHVSGGVDDLETALEEVKAINEMLETIYVSRGGADREAIRAAMAKDKLLLPEEAKALGLVDEITPAMSFTAMIDREKVKARWGEKALCHLENVAQTGNNMGIWNRDKGPSEREKFLAEAIAAVDEQFDIEASVKAGDKEAFAKHIDARVEAVAESIAAKAREKVFADIGGALGGTFKDAAEIKAHVENAIAQEVPKQIAAMGYKPTPKAAAGKTTEDASAGEANKHNRIARVMTAWAERELAAAKGGK